MTGPWDPSNPGSPWLPQKPVRLRVLWKKMLSEGDAVQVVVDGDGKKQIEIVGYRGSELATEDGEECIRFPVSNDSDRAALLEAIEEARKP